LRIGAGGATGTLGAGNTIDNGSLGFNRTDKAYTYAGNISGTGGVTNFGSGTITLTGNNTYAAGTSVSAGAFFINNTAGSGTGSGSVIVANTATLGGQGFIGGPVTVNAGGTLSPGAAATSVGTLTINSDLSLAGNVAISINKSLSPSNSSVVVTGALNNSGSGTVKITNLGPQLKPGDTFHIFSQPVSGGASLLVIGGGAIWNNNLPVDGTISIISLPTPVINSVSINGTNFLFSGTNGAFSGPYALLSTTNVSLPLTKWTTVLTGSYDGSGNFSGTTGISTNPPQKFFILESQ
jgi:fibronectin-binding autotransporter adhesin